eukprot:GGOE01043822.1.p1 GENE.GGOE01043822.1~~GGOE01043822.1.p1  ORF type:complete len:1096 (-),score=284.87 GGOE01043822.1:897-4184(-)
MPTKSIDLCPLGTRIFFKHAKHSWVYGTLVGRNRTACIAQSCETITQAGEAIAQHQCVGVSATDVIPAEDIVTTAENLLDITSGHEAAVLYILRDRHRTDLFYTRMGPVLLALNPMKPEAAPGDLFTSDFLANPKPHVWSTAFEAYRAIMETGTDQSIVLSGISGSGKTHTVKQIVEFLGRCTEMHRVPADMTAQSRSIAAKLEAAFALLEAFGNASTLLNANSSRFGSVLVLQFQAGVYCGAEFTTYLLEAKRVLGHLPGERSFHAFYELLAGASPRDRSLWDIEESPNQYACLAGSPPSQLADRENYHTVRRAMAELGIELELQDTIYRLLAAILHLSNADTGRPLQESRMPPAVAVAAGLLQVPAEELLSCLLHVERPRETLKPRPSQTNIGALCMALYSGLFTWLVEQINRALRSPVAQYECLGIVDMFGFEQAQRNSFQQLCINTAAEAFQSHYTRNVFPPGQRDQAEGSEMEASLADNTAVMQLLCGRDGILALLDAECVDPAGSEASWLRTMDHRVTRRFKGYYSVPEGRPDSFTVRHYAATVTYSAHGCIEENCMVLPQAVQAVLRRSGDVLLRNLHLPPPLLSSPSSTMGRSFISSLRDLFDNINDTKSRWICCLLPDPSRRAGNFDGNFVLHQLRCSGVPATIQAHHAGYSHALPHEEFARSFWCLIHRPPRVPRHDHICRCQLILSTAGLNNSPDVQLTRTNVQLRHFAFADLMHERAWRLRRHAMTVQCCVRAALAMRLAEQTWLAAGHTGRPPFLRRTIMPDSEESISESLGHEPIGQESEEDGDGWWLRRRQRNQALGSLSPSRRASSDVTMPVSRTKVYRRVQQEYGELRQRRPDITNGRSPQGKAAPKLRTSSRSSASQSRQPSPSRAPKAAARNSLTPISRERPLWHNTAPIPQALGTTTDEPGPPLEATCTVPRSVSHASPPHRGTYPWETYIETCLDMAVRGGIIEESQSASLYPILTKPVLAVTQPYVAESRPIGVATLHDPRAAVRSSASVCEPHHGITCAVSTADLQPMWPGSIHEAPAAIAGAGPVFFHQRRQSPGPGGGTGNGEVILLDTCIQPPASVPVDLEWEELPLSP